MAISKSFRINDKHVVHEAFDGEILAINLDTGTYYSLTGSSARIWSFCVAGADVEAIVGALSELYDGDHGVIASAVEEFIGKMRTENLVLPSEASSPTHPIALSPPSPEKVPFVPPAMEIYSDMQELLLLDPIHEVDDAGWPAVKSIPNEVKA